MADPAVLVADPATNVILNSATLHGHVSDVPVTDQFTLRWGYAAAGPYPNISPAIVGNTGAQVISLDIAGIPDTAQVYWIVQQSVTIGGALVLASNVEALRVYSRDAVIEGVDGAFCVPVCAANDGVQLALLSCGGPCPPTLTTPPPAPPG